MEELKLLLFPEQKIAEMKKQEGWENAVSFPFARDIGVIPVLITEEEWQEVLLPCKDDASFGWYLRQVNPQYMLIPFDEMPWFGGSPGEIPEGMFILSRRSRGDGGLSRFGASIFCHREVCEEIADEFGEGFYIIPSSVHELFILPESFVIGTENLDKLLGYLNYLNDVIKRFHPNDFLSEHLYYYNDKTGEVTDVA